MRKQPISQNPMRVQVGDLVVTPLCELPEDYMKMLDQADTLFKLQSGIASYEPIAADAVKLVKTMDEHTFTGFRQAMAKERKGQFCGDGWADLVGVILMPEVIFRVAIIAARFKAPWGVAFCQMNKAGLIHIEGEIVYVLEQPSAEIPEEEQ